MDEEKDKRFSLIRNDPRFRKIPQHERKIKIDQRFTSMFNDKQFQIKYSVDKRGRPQQATSSDNLKKYYHISSDEDEKEDKEEQTEEDVLKCEKKDVKNISKVVLKKLKDINVDYARGEGKILTDSSSEEESSEDEEEEEEFDWGELDKDAERTDEVTKRLAICNMDWDRIRAEDLMVLFHSFVPSGGTILSITVYPSEFGLARLKEEEENGPPELRDEEKKISGDNVLSQDDDEDTKKHMEKLRKYQLARLKYYYAVMECDSENTANSIYRECDGLEYESSTNKLDLRFIPDDTTFEQNPREVCTSLPDFTKYTPRLFRTSALTQLKVELTWDETDPGRLEAVKSFHNKEKGKELDEERLMNYVACSSSDDDEDHDEKGENLQEEEESEESETENKNENNSIEKYKALLANIEEQEEKKKKNKVDVQVSWDLGLEKKTGKLVKETIKEYEDANQTPFEQYLTKRKDKKKKKKEDRKQKINTNPEIEEDSEAFSDDDIPSDIDLNDEYFAEERLATKKKKKAPKQMQNEEDETAKEKQAELELLLMDGENTEGKKHFSFKKIEENEKEKKKKKFKKGKKRKMDESNFEDDFKLDVHDDRFSAIFTSHHYNIDPADPRFKATKATKDIINEKLRRRLAGEEEPKISKAASAEKRNDPELSLLVKKLKRNTSKNKN